jgi:hypothetical protein
MQNASTLKRFPYPGAHSEPVNLKEDVRLAPWATQQHTNGHSSAGAKAGRVRTC